MQAGSFPSEWDDFPSVAIGYQTEDIHLMSQEAEKHTRDCPITVFGFLFANIWLAPL